MAYRRPVHRLGGLAPSISPCVYYRFRSRIVFPEIRNFQQPCSIM
jgi:hypothetical protein